MPTLSEGRVFRGVAALSACALAAVIYTPSRAQAPPEHPPETSSGEKIPVEVFQAPQLKRGTLYVDLVPNHHNDLLRDDRNKYLPPNGSWVTLSMMVDPSGKPFEIAVIDSSGNKALNDAVLEGAQDARFVPGSVNGKPIESSFAFVYRFVIQGVQPGVNREFMEAIKSLTAAIQAKDRSAADAVMQKVKIENAIEDAYFGLATYQYAQVWGDEAEQLEALRHAIVWPDNGNIVPKDLITLALRACLQLELKTHEYGEAIPTWTRLQKLGVDAGTVAKVTPIMQELGQLRLDHREVEVSGQIRNGSWFLQLFKPQFRIEVTNGLISDVRVRCERRYLSFTFDPKLQYQVSGNSGDCSIQLEGTEGTRFKFVEF